MADDRRVQYVVIPHPDDEFQAWSLIEGQDDYRVFILLTHGEGTGMADGRGLQADRGERVPQPQPFHGPRSSFIHAQRLDSWHVFLDGMAVTDPTLDVPPFHGHVRTSAPTPAARGGCDVFVGERTARVVFDLGDGGLTSAAVEWAMRTVRAQVLPLLPVQREGGAIGASYYNAIYSGPLYTHVDHRAVHLALWNVDFGLPDAQWCRTTHSDPDVAATGGVTLAVTSAGYEAAMAVTSDGFRVGHFQRAYGWLAVDPSGYFPPAPGPTEDGGVSRHQSFWKRF